MNSARAVDEKLPAMLRRNRRMSTWLSLDQAGVIRLRSGKVEYGQGIVTALAQVAAEELGVDLGRIRPVPPTTGVSPDEGRTAGSRSIEESAPALRQVCAEVRHAFLEAASHRLGAEPGELRVDDGTIVGPSGTTTSYWELATDVNLDRDVDGSARPRSAAPGRWVGQPAGRLDLYEKIRGRGHFIHDLVLPAMLHGRIARPPTMYGRCIEVRAPDGVAATLVRDGDFVGVLASRETDAIEAARRITADARWEPVGPPPVEGDLREHLRTAPSESHVIGAGPTTPASGESGTIDGRAHTASYSRPFLAHASLGPSCAVAQWHGNELEVWCATQGIYPLRAELARAFSLPVEGVCVHHLEGAGCYGHNGADDAAYEAALLARKADGQPVRLQWSREDELGWAPFGPAAVAELRGTVGSDGHIATWSHELWSYGSRGRPGFSPTGPAFWAAAQLGDPFPRQTSQLGGATRNLEPGYAIDQPRLVAHRLLEQPVRTSSLRALGAHLNVFAIESFLDELADLVAMDPVAFRLANLDDDRAIRVIQLAAEEGRWSEQLPEGHGRGIGYARYKGAGAYCAAVATVEAASHLRVLDLVLAVDAGLVINPDGLSNQVSGGAVQATSWTTTEQVRHTAEGVTSRTFETYPILRFTEVPRVRVVKVPWQGEPSLGVGEAAIGPTAAAIANALYHAIGLRVRDMPLTDERIGRAAAG